MLPLVVLKGINVSFFKITSVKNENKINESWRALWIEYRTALVIETCMLAINISESWNLTENSSHYMKL